MEGMTLLDRVLIHPTAGIALLAMLEVVNVAVAGETMATPGRVNLPDKEIARAYDRAARQNVLAAVNHKIFFGYWSVCADGKGFGYGNHFATCSG